MPIFGYARVSAADQNLATQIEKLKHYGVDELITEKITGISKEKLLNDLINRLDGGDTLVAIRMDRLGRNARQLLELAEELEEKGVNLVILDLNIDTSTATGKFFLTVMAAFAELERTTLKEKQKNGIALAKRNGSQFGRPKSYGQQHKGLQHAVQLYEKGEHTVKEICEITQVSRASFYRYKRIKQ